MVKFPHEFVLGSWDDNNTYLLESTRKGLRLLSTDHGGPPPACQRSNVSISPKPRQDFIMVDMHKGGERAASLDMTRIFKGKYHHFSSDAAGLQNYC